MSRLNFALLIILAQAVEQSEAIARTWTDTTGKYTIEADLIGFDEGTVILQRADHELGALAIDKLSERDREYLKSKEADETRGKLAKQEQTWTLRDGAKLIGRVVDFCHKDITIQRRRGRIYINDRLFGNLPEFYQLMIPKIVAHFDKLNQADARGLEAWAVRQRGQPRTFHLEGVILELENGDEYGIPFFFFSDEDLAILEPGWNSWHAAHEDYESRNRHAFMLQSLAAARHRDAEVQRQIALMQLNLQAVQTGVTSLWEVTLNPARGNASPPLWVVVPGRDSRQATAAALAQNPGYVAGPVRRVGGF
jgi:hypothetical protein